MSKYHTTLQQLLHQLGRCEASQQHEPLQRYYHDVIQSVQRLQQMPEGSAGSEAWCHALYQVLLSLYRPQLSAPFCFSPAYYLSSSFATYAQLAQVLVSWWHEWDGAVRQAVSVEFNALPQSTPLTSYLSRRHRLTRWLCPLLLLWDMCTWVGNRVCSRLFMGSMILPALSVSDWSQQVSPIAADRLQQECLQRLPAAWHWQRRILPYAGGALSIIDIQAHAPSSQGAVKTIVYCLGNLNIYPLSEQSLLDDIARLHQKDQSVRAIFWHYPGVYDSFGKVQRPRDLVQAGLHVLQYVFDSGSDPRETVIKGHSLGGYVGTYLAYCCQQCGFAVRLWNDRSLSDAPNYLFAKWVTRYGSGHVLRPWLVRCLALLCHPLVWLLSRMIRCEMPAAWLFMRLAPGSADYILVRAPAHIRQSIEIADDSVIQDHASLDHGGWFVVMNALLRRYHPSEHHYYAQDDPAEDAHGMPLQQLYPSSVFVSGTAQDRFIRFVLRDELPAIESGV